MGWIENAVEITGQILTAKLANVSNNAINVSNAQNFIGDQQNDKDYELQKNIANPVLKCKRKFFMKIFCTR